MTHQTWLFVALLLLSITSVQCIGPIAAYFIGNAAQLTVAVLVEYIKGIFDGDDELRSEFTKGTVDRLVSEDDRFLYVVVRDYIWRESTAKGVISSQHYELEGKGGLGSYGYAIVIFNKREDCSFTKNGDGGWINWAYSAGWTRSDDTISYTAPSSPALDELVNECVNIFSPYHYKYVTKEDQYVTGQFADRDRAASWERFELRQQDDTYYFVGLAHGGMLYCETFTIQNNWYNIITKVDKGWFPECEKSDNCYAIKSTTDGGGYFVAEDDGALNCNRQQIGDWEVFVIEPCGLFY